MSITLVNEGKGTGAVSRGGAESPRPVARRRGGLEHPPKNKNEKWEYAWTNGPLRKVGAKSDSRVVYVCGMCLKPGPGVYRVEGLKSAGIAKSDWVGGECKRSAIEQVLKFRVFNQKTASGAI